MDSINEVEGKDVIGLIADNWNDWFTFKTMYSVVYFDANGFCKNLGSVKIGEKDQEEGRPDLPFGTVSSLGKRAG